MPGEYQALSGDYHTWSKSATVLLGSSRDNQLVTVEMVVPNLDHCTVHWFSYPFPGGQRDEREELIRSANPH